MNFKLTQLTFVTLLCVLMYLISSSTIASGALDELEDLKPDVKQTYKSLCKRTIKPADAGKIFQAAITHPSISSKEKGLAINSLVTLHYLLQGEAEFITDSEAEQYLVQIITAENLGLSQEKKVNATLMLVKQLCNGWMKITSNKQAEQFLLQALPNAQQPQKDLCARWLVTMYYQQRTHVTTYEQVMGYAHQVVKSKHIVRSNERDLVRKMASEIQQREHSKKS